MIQTAPVAVCTLSAPSAFADRRTNPERRPPRGSQIDLGREGPKDSRILLPVGDKIPQDLGGPAFLEQVAARGREFDSRRETIAHFHIPELIGRRERALLAGRVGRRQINLRRRPLIVGLQLHVLLAVGRAVADAAVVKLVHRAGQLGELGRGPGQDGGGGGAKRAFLLVNSRHHRTNARPAAATPVANRAGINQRESTVPPGRQMFSAFSR